MKTPPSVFCHAISGSAGEPALGPAALGVPRGLLAWRSAYLEAHFPREFLCAIFRHHAGMYPFAAFVAEARRMRVPLLLPCVHRSQRHFELEGDGIRISLGAVKGLSERTIETIHRARPFASIEDLRRRGGATQPELEDLALVGACSESIRRRARRRVLPRLGMATRTTTPTTSPIPSRRRASDAGPS
jgi:DNA polymerase III alpha subunit